MAHGGPRKGAGRRPGALTKKTRAIAEKAAEEGITPLEVLLGTMRGFWDQAGLETDTEKKLAAQLAASDVAKDAAPYMHPRLAAVEHSGGMTLRHEDALGELE